MYPIRAYGHLILSYCIALHFFHFFFRFFQTRKEIYLNHTHIAKIYFTEFIYQYVLLLMRY